jgi:hypothetical protein
MTLHRTSRQAPAQGTLYIERPQGLSHQSIHPSYREARSTHHNLPDRSGLLSRHRGERRRPLASRAYAPAGQKQAVAVRYRRWRWQKSKSSLATPLG